MDNYTGENHSDEIIDVSNINENKSSLINIQKKTELIVNKNAKAALKTTSSWAAFFSVMLFISVGFLFLGGLLILVLGAIFPFLPAEEEVPFGMFIFLGIIYMIMAVVMFFPALYLFKFSQKIPDAVHKNNPNILEDAFINMKYYWKYMGIMTIVSIGLSILMFPIAIFLSVAGIF